MKDLLAKSYLYELVDKNDNCFKYDFVSQGIRDIPKRVSIQNIHPGYPNYFNLGFGDILIDDLGQERIDDKSRNINKHEADRILSTALLCCLDFLSETSFAKVIFFGNTRAKHRLYKIKLCGLLPELEKYVDIYGAVIESYPIILDRDGFKQLTEPIEPEKIRYEQFATSNCWSYNFMMIGLKE